MSSVIEIARHLMAVMQPQTGDRATGIATITASGADVVIPRGTYALPVVQGQVRADLAFKVGEGANADKSWTVTSAGTDVDFLSNIGGARHNLADGTPMIFDPPIDGIASVVTSGAFTGGTDPEFLGGVKDMLMLEQLEKTDPQIDLGRSAIKGFPAVVVTWQGSRDIELVRRGTARADETFSISIISSRTESDHMRRQEGQVILYDLSALLIDRHAVDGSPFSNPEGIHITSRGRESGNHKTYQAFRIYYLVVGVDAVIKQRDTRTYSDFALLNMDVLKPQDPALPDQGDYTVVNDNQVDMSV
ncbi:MAG: hypothetical protein GY854_02295 [Deltaproteobacteria bacterium]|nr:hypothetical protein [Deltaproteobacteria bacterium]